MFKTNDLSLFPFIAVFFNKLVANINILQGCDMLSISTHKYILRFLP